MSDDKAVFQNHCAICDAVFQSSDEDADECEECRAMLDRAEQIGAGPDLSALDGDEEDEEDEDRDAAFFKEMRNR